jgi:hypothetical protein
MGVIFNEVITTVEAPTSVPQEANLSEQQLNNRENNEEKISLVIETQQRRAKRLWTD